MEKNNKVLFVATVTGHINKFHLPYLKLFKDHGWEVQVATGDDKEVKDYCDKKYNVGIKRNPLKIGNIKSIRKLRKVIDDEKFDIIHCHTPMGAVVARLAARKARKKYGTRVIYTAHGFHFFKGAPLKNWLLFYPIEKWLAKYTDTLITINNEDYELAKRKFGKRCKDIRYVPGVGIDVNRFKIKFSEVEKSDLRESLGLKKDDFILACVARLDRNKNQGFLINVMQELVKEKDNIHLLLAGKDEINGYYQNLVKEKNLDKNVHFLGSRNDVPEILSITNIVLSASKREGLPVNVMEAFASEVPVVALKCRGMEDLVVNGENGFIVENYNENIKSFAKQIIELCNDKKLCEQICKNNEIKAIDYDIVSIEKKMNDIYNI